MWHAFLIATDYELISIVCSLLERGVEIDIVDPGYNAWGWAPWTCAYEHGSVEVLRVLLQLETNLNCRAGESLRQFGIAALRVQEMITVVLLKPERASLFESLRSNIAP